MYPTTGHGERESRIATAAADHYCAATGTTTAGNCSAAGNDDSTGARDVNNPPAAGRPLAAPASIPTTRQFKLQSTRS